MNSKPTVGVLLLASALLQSPLSITQAQEMTGTARSFSANGVSQPVAKIEAMRRASKGIFALLDVNNSGSITLDEIDILTTLIEGEDTLPTDELASLRQRSSIISRMFMYVEEDVDQFEVADIDNNGSLSESEFEIREISLRTHILQLNIDALDIDKNGGVEFSEFSAHLDAIDDLDKDGDGSLSRAELRESSNPRILHDVRTSHWHRQLSEEQRAKEAQSKEKDQTIKR